ncbi:probable mitochondrial import inner membrane translocase subunit TIM21 [Syzygium oleosum]|uniref:probable mitochondrial import inner membrane translocase subunit TIM21 n=1 Tax=Syzygium oleosum TaxID=219896 RepID=UPI0024B8B2CA|nr:probable mitochondrial import inner membrane translocase subunit TIM21 [Syzygium oleosum]
MQHMKRSAACLNVRWTGLMRLRNGSSSLPDLQRSSSVSEVGLSSFSSSAVATSSRSKSGVFKSGYVRSTLHTELMTKGILGAKGIHVPLRVLHNRKGIRLSPSQLLYTGANVDCRIPSLSRSFASRSSEKKGETASETKKDVSTIEDPFDAPTYNIPEKPVTFVEGASYSLIILAGLGIAAAAAYGVFNELIFQPKEYKIFNMALKRIQDDSQVRIRIGSPITGYGQESRNRAARQRIPHRVWTDEDGVEHIEVNFYIRGPHGAGKVFCRMFKDKVEKQWKFTSLIVQIMSPSPAQLLLESYVPA